MAPAARSILSLQAATLGERQLSTTTTRIDLELRRFDLGTGGFTRVFKRRVQPSEGPAAVRLQATG